MGKSTVGIIANPESGRDIRRLVAHASVFDNMEKVNIVKRLIITLQELGVEKIIGMPDTFGIVSRAVEAVEHHLKIDVDLIKMDVFGDWRDTLKATEILRDKASAIIVIGGDGTNRIVAKACGDMPIMPLSTGTNNVFPYMIEATVAGAAVAAIATRIVKPEEGTYTTKRIELYENRKLKDIALIDAAATTYSFTGSKAIWKIDNVKELIVSRSSPFSIGLSSIAGIVREISVEDDVGLYLRIGEGRLVRAPIAPGVFEVVPVKEIREIPLDEHVEIHTSPALFSLDGEREIELNGDITARLARNGPRVIDYKKTLKLAAERGFFEVQSSLISSSSTRFSRSAG